MSRGTDRPSAFPPDHTRRIEFLGGVKVLQRITVFFLIQEFNPFGVEQLGTVGGRRIGLRIDRRSGREITRGATILWRAAARWLDSRPAPMAFGPRRSWRMSNSLIVA